MRNDAFANVVYWVDRQYRPESSPKKMPEKATSCPEPRSLHLLEAADKQEDDRERNKAREVAPERHEVAWGVNEARERSMPPSKMTSRTS